MSSKREECRMITAKVKEKSWQNYLMLVEKKREEGEKEDVAPICEGMGNVCFFSAHSRFYNIKKALITFRTPY